MKTLDSDYRIDWGDGAKVVVSKPDYSVFPPGENIVCRGCPCDLSAYDLAQTGGKTGTVVKEVQNGAHV